MKKRLVVALGSAVMMAACANTPAQEAAAPESSTPPAVAETGNATPATASRPPVELTGRSRPSDRPDATRSAAASAAEPAAAPAPVPEFREVMIPAGTMVRLRLASPLASDSSQVEDVVRATLRDDVTLEDGSVLAAGNEVVGRITDVERSGRVRGRARIAFRFTTLRYDGDEYDIRTEAVERLAAATKSEDATKIGIGAGAGAALGAVLGGGALGIVLTGMGRDGAEGARRLVEAGGSVMAQDELSSAVWGMPRAVADAGLACAVLSPEKLARRVASRAEEGSCK